MCWPKENKGKHETTLAHRQAGHRRIAARALVPDLLPGVRRHRRPAVPVRPDRIARTGLHRPVAPAGHLHPAAPWRSCRSSSSSPPCARWPATARPASSNTCCPCRYRWRPGSGARSSAATSSSSCRYSAPWCWRVLIALVRDIEVPWGMFGYYTALLAVMAACFLGIGMLISALARSTDMAQGAAFVVWLTLLLFLDLILLGVMIQGKVAPEVAVTHGAGQSAAGVPHRRAGAVRPATDRAGAVGLRHPRPVRRHRLQDLRAGLPDAARHLWRQPWATQLFRRGDLP